MIHINYPLVNSSAGESVYELINPEQDKMVLNVGGIRHETLIATLSSRPGTRLSELARLHQISPAEEYFFDRNPEVFNAVIDYYRSGELHIPMDVCGVVIRRELEYWSLKETLIHPCCWVHYCTNVDKVEALDSLNRLPEDQERENEAMLTFKGVAKVRLTIWRLMFRPNSSVYAKAYSFVSMMFVMAAISGCCLETVSSLQDKDYALQYQHKCLHLEPTNNTEDPFQRLLPQPIYALRVLDYLCNSFFSVELLIRLIVALKPLTFIKNPIIIIDITAIIPFYLMLLFDAFYAESCNRDKSFYFLQIVFVLRIVRIFRVFQMLAYFKPLKILLRSLRDSVYELLILFVFILICMLVFATLAFYAEIDDEKSTFTTIPVGFWWALITITTVGYGDMVPRTIAGYFVGGACALCGTVIMALTIPILSNNFTLYYTHSRTRERADVKEKLRESKLQEEEQSDGPKKSVLQDGSILVRKPTKPIVQPDLEKELMFRRESAIVRSSQELNHIRVVLVGQGEVDAFRAKSHDKISSVDETLDPDEPIGTLDEPLTEPLTEPLNKETNTL